MNGEIRRRGTPTCLRAAQIEGAVMARFTYNCEGTVDPASVNVLTIDRHALLTESRSRVPLRAGTGTAEHDVAQVPFDLRASMTKTGKDLAGYPGGLPERRSMVVKGTRDPSDRVASLERRPGPHASQRGSDLLRVPGRAAGASAAGQSRDRAIRTCCARPTSKGEVLAQFVVGTGRAIRT